MGRPVLQQQILVLLYGLVAELEDEWRYTAQEIIPAPVPFSWTPSRIRAHAALSFEWELGLLSSVDGYHRVPSTSTND